MVFNDLSKGLVIKYKDQHIREDECINEYVGVAVNSKNKINHYMIVDMKQCCAQWNLISTHA